MFGGDGETLMGHVSARPMQFFVLSLCSIKFGVFSSFFYGEHNNFYTPHSDK